MKVAVMAVCLLWAAAASAAAPAWFPGVACEKFWSTGITRTPAGAARSPGDYDEQRDAKPTSAGNLGYEGYQARARRRHCFKPWTVLVFMNVDKDLSPYAYQEIYDMEAASPKGGKFMGSTNKSDLLVQMDDNAAGTSTRYHIFQGKEVFKKGLTKSDFAKTNPGDIYSPVVIRAPEKILGSDAENRFLKFLTWGIREYPAQHYIVAVWGHGIGWNVAPLRIQSVFTLASRDNMIVPPFLDLDILGDGTVDRPFDTGRLASALAEGAGLLGRPLDILITDACLMQTVEVGDEMTSARFIVGSSQILPYLGIPYRRLMYEVNAGSATGAANGMPARDPVRDLAASIPAFSQYYARQSESAEWMTASAVDTDRLDHELAPQLQILGESLRAYMTGDPNKAIVLQQVIQKTPSFLGSGRDLGLFLSLLEATLQSGPVPNQTTSPKNPLASSPADTNAMAIESSIRLSRDALEHSLVNSVFGVRYLNLEKQIGASGFRGLGVWLPEDQDEFHIRAAEFGRSRFYRQGDLPAFHGGWKGWLQELFNVP